MLIIRKSLLKNLSLKLLNNKAFEFFIIFLTVIYSITVFINLAMQEKTIKNSFSQEERDLLIYANQMIEMIVLIIFVMEITAKIYVYSFEVFLKKIKIIFIIHN